MNCEDLLPKLLERCSSCGSARECQLSYLAKKYLEIVKIAKV